MKTNNFTFLKTIKTMAIIIVFTFSTNIHAASVSSWGNWWGNFWGNFWGNNHTHYRGCGHNGSGSGGSTDTVPLDGGLGILLVGAAAFGVKKLRESKNDQV